MRNVVKDWGTPVTGSIKSIVSPDLYPMVNGRYYTTTYQVSGLRTWFPGWEDSAINDIRNDISTNPNYHGTCSPQYIRVVDDGQVIVQWRYTQTSTTDQLTGRPMAIPVVVGYIILGILVVLGLWLLYKSVSTVGEILIEDNPSVRLATIAVIIIASASLLVAGGYFYKHVVKDYIESRAVG